MYACHLWECLIRLYWVYHRTCLRRCTKRPRVETRATENPVRPCVLCCLWLWADAGSVSGPRVSKSASTWPNMACSRPRLDWSPLREVTEEPSSSELWETHFLVLLVRPLILPETYRDAQKNNSTHFFFLSQHLAVHMMTYPHRVTHYEVADTFWILPDWLRGSSGFRTWETWTDGSSLPSSDWLCLDRMRWTATVALRAETRWDKFVWRKRLHT